MEPLATKLGRLQDPRSPRGQTYPFVGMLLQVVVAVLGGARGLEEISRFGRLRGAPFAHALGYRSGRTPCKAAFHLLLKKLAIDAFERALAEFVAERLKATGREFDHLALDGKTLRGSRRGAIPGAHLLALYAPQAGAAVAQLRKDGKTNEHKAALDLLGMADLEGKVVSGDAAFCQKDVAALLVKKADYLLAVKDNQRGLRSAIKRMFRELRDAPEAKRRRHRHGLARTTNKGHGRRETRTLEVRTVPLGHFGWAGLAQVYKIERTRTRGGKTTTETAYGITSLTAAEADPRRLLELVRQHWAIEMLHWRRDVTMGEDACLVTSGSAPQALAATRNAGIAIHHPNPKRTLPQALAEVACDWRVGLALLSTLKL